MKGKLNLNHAGHAGNHFAASFLGAAPWCGLVTEFALRVSASRSFFLNQPPSRQVRQGITQNQPMKKLKLFLLGLGGLCALAVSSPAQTNAPTSVPSFLATSQSWLTSFNTNYTFTGVTFEFSTGYKQQVGVNAASFATVQYDINRFNLGADFQFSGVGSAVNQAEAQIGYAIIDHFDTRLEADLGVGYNAISASAVIEPELILKKKLTENTFAETGLSLPQFTKGSLNTSPSFWVGAGFTY